MNDDINIAKQPMIRWDISKSDMAFIHKIVARAAKEFPGPKYKWDQTGMEMDLAACHLNGCLLRLPDLLKASKPDFAHDVWGIRRFIDRETGKLTDCFLPRFHAGKKATQP